MRKIINLVGRKIGMLTVIEKSKTRMNGYVCWKCKCECGNVTLMRSQLLNLNRIKSCGCIMIKHREPKFSKEYMAWCNIKARCMNKNRPDYHRYGGRGITICDRWVGDFNTFLSDVGRSPNPKYSLDRIDNNKGYSPDNCRWSTNKEQANNRRSNRTITIESKTLTTSEWAKLRGVSERLIRVRLNRGWSEKEAVMTPLKGGD